MTLTKQQADALRNVVEAKLRLWDAANEAERLLQVDVDSNGGGLNDLCASMGRRLVHGELFQAGTRRLSSDQPARV